MAGKDGSSGVVAQMSAIKLTMTQERWGQFPPSSVYSFYIYSNNILRSSVVSKG